MKISESDASLSDYNDTSLLFRNMFPDSKICKAFTVGRQKASYVIKNGIGSLLEEKFCESVSNSSVGFTYMFDETTTV